MTAVCGSDRTEPHGFSPLANALDDDGGLGADASIRWIEDGKTMAREALSGAVWPTVWMREYFSVEIDGPRAIAYAEDDPRCNEQLPTELFLAVLQAWQDFLIAGPTSQSRTFEIADGLNGRVQ